MNDLEWNGPDDADELAPDADPTTPVESVSPLRRLQLTEPVRLYLYPVFVAVLGLLVAYGVVDDTLSPLYEALIGAVLAVGGRQVIEHVRDSVWSERSATRAVLQAGLSRGLAERSYASLTAAAAVARYRTAAAAAAAGEAPYDQTSEAQW